MIPRTETVKAALLAAVLVMACHASWSVLIGRVLADNSTTPAKPATFSPNTLIKSSDINADFDALYNGLANIGRANILTDGVGTSQVQAGAISLTKLGSDVTAFLVPTGTIEDYVGDVHLAAPSGWVRAGGLTISDGSGAGTERANADTATLFALLWNSMTNTQAPVSGGRGGSASADFAAHKTIQLPDLRGRACVALDNLGNSAANRITAGANFDATVLGNAGGAETHLMQLTELVAHNHTATSTDSGHSHTQVAHTHTVTDSGHTHAYFRPNGTISVRNDANQISVAAPSVSDFTVSGNAVITASSIAPTINSGNAVITTTVNNTGGGAAFTVLSPTYAVSKIIKLYYPIDVH